MEKLKIISAENMRQASLENQIKAVNKIFDDFKLCDVEYVQPAVLLENVVLLPEIVEELTKNGHDVKIFEGKNTEDSWSEISWYKAEKQREGEKRCLQ